MLSLRKQPAAGKTEFAEGECTGRDAKGGVQREGVQREGVQRERVQRQGVQRGCRGMGYRRGGCRGLSDGSQSSFPAPSDHASLTSSEKSVIFSEPRFPHP